MSDAALLVQNVRRSMAGTHDVLGFVGIDASGARVLLGRDLATGALVGISVTVDAANETQHAVQRTLGKTVTVPGSMCPECRTPLPELDAFCFHCGANLTGSTAAEGTPESAIVLQALETATAGRYELLGRIDREGNTAAVYFAREVDNDSLAALRLKRVDFAAASHPDYVTKLTQIFETAELQAKIAKRKAQQAEAERAAAERVAAERVAAERAAAERIAAERAAAERAAAERAAAERAAAERAAAERVAAERAAAERAAAERVAAERAAAERIAAERAAAAERVAAERAAAERAAAERAAAERAAAERIAAERAAAERAATERAAAESIAAKRTATAAVYMPPPIADFSLQQESETVPASQQFVQSDATANADDERPKKSGSMRTPLIGVGVAAALAVIGYFAFSSGSNPPPVATTPATTDSISAPVAAQPATDSVASTTPATADAAAAPTTSAAATQPVGAASDSGTIRLAAFPADARVTVDGKTMRGRTLRVTARSHQLTVTAKGFEPFTEKLTVASGATIRWSPKLVAIVAANAPTNSAPSAVASSNPTPTSSKKSCRDLMRAEDWSAAHDACESEANAGNAVASANLGRMYAKGLGVTPDPSAAANWYRKAAAGDDHDAQSFMGFALRDGKGVKRDEKAAAEMFKLAAEGGEKLAQLEYAVALEKGDGVNKNQASAREWYKKAADQGLFMAARRLGRMFEKGDGGPKSEPDALAAYEKAATLGDAESAMTAGKWYRDGRGASQSPAQALTWFKKALELGNKDAQNEIKKLQK